MVRLLQRLRKENTSLYESIKKIERETRRRDSIWEARLRYARRGLEVTNRELGFANSKFAKVNRELTALKDQLEKKVEERTSELRLERDRVNQIITQLSDGLILIDEKERITFVNQQAESLLHVPSKELVGHSHQDFQRHRVLADFFSLIGKGGINTALFRKPFKLEERVLEVTKTSLRAGKRTLGTMILAHDITREALIDRLKSEFVSLAAHQLRTPLSVVKWTLRAVLDGDVGPLRAEQQDLLEKGYKTNERMIRLVNDLLSVVNIEEGRFNYKFRRKHLLPIIESVIEEVRILMKQKGIKLSYRTPSHEFPKVLLDSDKIRLAFSNIIDNAIKYTLRGGRVSVIVKKKQNSLLVSVKDTGIGISKQQLDRVFTKFFRGYNAVKIQTEGNGLGLFIAKNIIEKHGGKIWLTSIENKGTTVFFTVPIAASRKRKLNN